MTIFTEGNHAGEFILSEGNKTVSRESITVLSGAGILAAGAVLGLVTASQKYIEYDEAAGDGSETAVAILHAGVDATSADAVGVALVRDAEVSNNNLAWKAGVDEAGGRADLALEHVIVRD